MKTLKAKKILLVDDDQYNLYALQAALDEYEPHLIIANNGVEAIQEVRATDDLHIVLMDIMMPEMDGYEAMAAIRAMKDRSALPIIALTAMARKQDIEKCMEAGATNYVSKPIDIANLIQIILQHIG